MSPLRDSKVEVLYLLDSQFDPNVVCLWPLKAISFQEETINNRAESTIRKVPREKLLRLKEIKTLETVNDKPVNEFWKEFDQSVR